MQYACGSEQGRDWSQSVGDGLADRDGDLSITGSDCDLDSESEFGGRRCRGWFDHGVNDGGRSLPYVDEHRGRRTLCGW